MNEKKHLMKFVLLCIAIVSFNVITEAGVSVKVFSREAGMGDYNLSKPRVYIENTGTETIDNFYYRYYFTTENGNVPVVDQYYTPNASVLIVPFGDGYYIQYNITGANLAPGSLLPHSDGNEVGLHYNDYSSWDKTDDYSNNLSETFAENPKITFYYNNTLVYGSEPGGVAGSVLREVWTGVSGITIADIPLGTLPNAIGYMSSLDAPKYTDDNYGARMRGYIIAPVSGDYTFFIASDDYSEFYLSTDDDPANKGNPAASVSGWTQPDEWYKFSSQRSSLKTLVAGNRYYIEILHKEGDQGDHCGVGWLKPGESGTPAIVPGTVLTPYVPEVIPDVPVLQATVVNENRIDLSWTNVQYEGGYLVEMALGNDAFGSPTNLIKDVTSLPITGLQPQTTYRFRVKAYNGFGSSDYSTIVTAVTSAVIEGKISREIWKNVPGFQVADIPLNTTATFTDEITSLETMSQYADYYGQRIRGYIIPPQSGVYTFWIASDDYSQLWLSTGDDPASKVLIASVSGYTNARDWYKYSTQKSADITLSAGVPYYIEILHKDGNQNDNLAVAWHKPGESRYTTPSVIQGNVLSPYYISTLPDAPDGLVASAISATQIDLTWNDNSNNENGFQIERALGDGTFALVQTAAADAAVFHDYGLSPNSQYRYRIRSINDQGPSGYTAVATATTLAQSVGTSLALELNSFGLYSSEKTEIRNEVLYNGGGAIGSNTFVEILPLSVINADVLSGGNILLRPQAQVNGDATAAGTVTLETAAVLNGDKYEGATVAEITIPEKTGISIGTQDVIVELDQDYGVLSPGNYKELKVKDRGKITLTAGRYTFSEFYLSTYTTVELDIGNSDIIEIDIEGDLEFSDYSQVVFKEDEGYAPFIRIYTNDDNDIRVGTDVHLNGIVTAPHGDIHIYSRTQCNGAIYAKTITIEPKVVISGGDVVNLCEDSDGDRVQNIIEIILNTEPDDPTSYVEMAIPSEACIDNSEEVNITYDFSYYYPSEYAAATLMEATFPANSLSNPNIPLLVVVTNEPLGGVPAFSNPDYDVLGRYIDFLPENSLVDGASFTFQTPHLQEASPVEYKPFQYDGTQWVEIPSTAIVGSDAISYTVEYDHSNPIVFAGIKQPDASRTLYFEGGEYVYSNTVNSILRFDIGVQLWEEDLSSVEIEVEYADYLSGTPVNETYREYCDVLSGLFRVNAVFYKRDPLVCSGEMRIKKVQLHFNHADATTDTYTYDCLSDFIVLPGQVLVMRSHGIAEWYPSMSDPISLFYYPCTETFESASFSEGRITYNTTAGGSSPYRYEYYLTDHLGSTRMVVDDQEQVTEAVMYQPYGTMEPLFTSTAALTVREKFTTKEFDEDGEDLVNGVEGIKAYYFGARYYDPEVGMWISRDAAEQFASGYLYTGNGTNPGIMVDRDGNFLGTILTYAEDFIETAFFRGGLDFTSKESMAKAWKRFDPTREGSKTNNAWKIDIGLFHTDSKKPWYGRAWQIVSRLSWEAPQVNVGNIVAHSKNITGSVKSVHHSDGATLVETHDKNWGGITFGNIILAQRGTTPETPLFMHEWGHTQQSMILGPSYLPVVGSWSGLDYVISGDYIKHNKIWPEKDANIRAHERFGDDYTWWDDHLKDLYYVEVKKREVKISADIF